MAALAAILAHIQKGLAQQLAPKPGLAPNKLFLRLSLDDMDADHALQVILGSETINLTGKEIMDALRAKQ